MSHPRGKSLTEEYGYILNNVAGTVEDNARLDMLHVAFRFYFGGRLSLAPLEEGPVPTAVLDMGSGSGAWAVQAAKTFPSAEVLALDLIPLPAGIYPPNLKFKQADLSKPFPQELRMGGFDIIHSRFTFVHLPRVYEVLYRTFPLVKPGGWLLIHDVTNTLKDPGGLGPGHQALWKILTSNMYSKQMDPFMVLRLQKIIESSGLFSEVNVHYLAAPVSKYNDPTVDPRQRRIGHAIRDSVLRALHTMTDKGVTQEIMDAVRKEFDEPWRNMTMDIFFFSAKRKQ